MSDNVQGRPHRFSLQPNTAQDDTAVAATFSRKDVSKLQATQKENRREIMVIVWWIIVGLIAGWATGKIMRGAGYGTLVDIVLGIVGAVVGGWIMRMLGFAGQGGMIYTILVAIGGAILLTLLVRLIFGSRTGGTGGLRRAA
jgi:uncharacterized membrane protein YeaQ/YmgE (transglycosylase-associated protein family)